MYFIFCKKIYRSSQFRSSSWKTFIDYFTLLSFINQLGWYHYYIIVVQYKNEILLCNCQFSNLKAMMILRKVCFHKIHSSCCIIISFCLQCLKFEPKFYFGHLLKALYSIHSFCIFQIQPTYEIVNSWEIILATTKLL